MFLAFKLSFGVANLAFWPLFPKNRRNFIQFLVTLKLTSLAVETAGGGGGTKGELGWAEPLVGAGAAGGSAGPVASADGVAGALAEREAEVAPARQERPEVV